MSITGKIRQASNFKSPTGESEEVGGGGGGGDPLSQRSRPKIRKNKYSTKASAIIPWEWGGGKVQRAQQNPQQIFSGLLSCQLLLLAPPMEEKNCKASVPLNPTSCFQPFSNRDESCLLTTSGSQVSINRLCLISRQSKSKGQSKAQQQ